MSDERQPTWDLRQGVGLYRWGDTRPAFQELFLDASYGVFENVYASRRVFFAPRFFAGLEPSELWDVDAYVDPLAPDVIFDGLGKEEAEALLAAVGCREAIGPDEQQWAAGEAKVIFHDRGGGNVWLKIEGPRGMAAALDDAYGSADETDD